MAKATQLFIGTDSFGAHNEYAQREDGIWFRRWQEIGHYGYKLTPWTYVHSDLVKHPESLGECSPEELKDFICCGFKTLKKTSTTKGTRLPSTEIVEQNDRRDPTEDAINAWKEEFSDENEDRLEMLAQAEERGEYDDHDFNEYY